MAVTYGRQATKGGGEHTHNSASAVHSSSQNHILTAIKIKNRHAYTALLWKCGELTAILLHVLHIYPKIKKFGTHAQPCFGNVVSLVYILSWRMYTKNKKVFFFVPGCRATLCFITTATTPGKYLTVDQQITCFLLRKAKVQGKQRLSVGTQRTHTLYIGQTAKRK